MTFSVDKHFPTIFVAMKITTAPCMPIQFESPLVNHRQAKHCCGPIAGATT
jgi:hypothetical protein